MIRRQKSAVGLDIGSSAVKAVELLSTAGTHSVVALGREPLPPGSVAAGIILDAGAVSDSIRRLFQRHRIRTKDVAVALSGTAVLMKWITLPAMSDLELAASITWEAEPHIPFDMEEVNLDYHVYGAGADVDAATMELLLAAATKESVARHVGVIASAGKTPVVIDVVPLALQNVYEANYGSAPGAVVALVDARASRTSIAVLRGDRMVTTREVPATENVALGIRASLDSLRQGGRADGINAIVVTGGASRAVGFTAALSESFNTRVEVLDPFRRIALEASRHEVDLSEAAATFAVAVGLALRTEGDR